MRLTQWEIKVIKSTLLDIFGEVQIYVFGSRLNDNIRGGDIDIFIIPDRAIENLRVKKAKAIFYLEEKLLKPIDLIIHRDFNRLIEREALKGVLL
jgi:predicted nucleotidyltransferase